MFTCLVKYDVDPSKVREFEEYARAWIRLIEKYGGIHHGYFLPPGPSDELPDAKFSFPGLGKEGPKNIGVALFSFPDVDAYEKYRKEVSFDSGCEAATARFHETKCFTGYERNFLKPISRQTGTL
jgi:hypothetical protein